MADLFPNNQYTHAFIPSTIDGINTTFGHRLQQEYDIKFIPPQYTVQYVLVPGNHPLGGQMNNWSRNASVDDINPSDIVRNLPIQNFMQTFDPKLKMEDYRYNNTQMFLDPSNQRMLPYIKRHEYKHAVNHAIPYNILNICAIKNYNRMRNMGYFRNPTDSTHLLILTNHVNEWLDSPMRKIPLLFMGNGINYNHSRRQILKRLTTDLDYKLDSHENEQNLYYTNVPLENDWLNEYGWFLPDM